MDRKDILELVGRNLLPLLDATSRSAFVSDKDFLKSALESLGTLLEKSTSASAVAGAKVLNDKNSLINTILDNITPMGSKMLKAVQEGTVIRHFETNNLGIDLNEFEKLLKKDDGSGGIYLISGYCKYGLFLYIGKTVKFCRRWTDHAGYIGEAPYILGKSTLLLYRLAKIWKQAGANINFHRLNILSPQTEYDKIVMGIMEGLWSFLLGTYQLKEELLQCRADLGIPAYSLLGANLTPCYNEAYSFKGSATYLNPTVETIYNQLILVIESLARAKARCFLKEFFTPIEIEVARQQKVELAQSIKTIRNALQVEVGRLLLEGTFATGLVHGRLSYSNTSFVMKNLYGLAVNDSVIQALYPGKIFQEEEELQVTATLVERSSIDLENDLFTHVPLFQKPLVQGLGIILSTGEKSCSWQIKSNFAGRKNRTKLVDTILTAIPSGSSRRAASKDMMLFDFPLNTSPLTQALMEGSIPFILFLTHPGTIMSVI